MYKLLKFLGIYKDNTTPFRLLDLPKDILVNNISEQLSLKELSRLARTCKSLNTLLGKALSEKKELKNALVIQNEINYDASYFKDHPLVSNLPIIRKF